LGDEGRAIETPPRPEPIVRAAGLRQLHKTWIGKMSPTLKAVDDNALYVERFIAINGDMPITQIRGEHIATATCSKRFRARRRLRRATILRSAIEAQPESALDRRNRRTSGRLLAHASPRPLRPCRRPRRLVRRGRVASRGPDHEASIEAAQPRDADDADPSLIAKAEVLLDRAHFSPGGIDGLDGDDFRHALRAFEEVNGLPATGKLDGAAWSALTTKDTGRVLKTYKISDPDIAGPFTKAIPARLEELARLRARRAVPYGAEPAPHAQSARGFRKSGRGPCRRRRARVETAFRPIHCGSGSAN